MNNITTSNIIISTNLNTIFALGATLLLLLTSSPSSAKRWLVDSNSGGFCTLQRAVEAATGGVSHGCTVIEPNVTKKIVVIPKSTAWWENRYELTGPLAVHDITIEGANGHVLTMPTITLRGTIEVNDNLTLKNLRFKAGKRFEDKSTELAFLIKPFANLSISNSKFTGFQGRDESVSGGDGPKGGVIRAERESSVYINNSWFHENGASAGGAIYARKNAYISAWDTTFSKNNVGLHGGAIYLIGALLDCIQCTFAQNTTRNRTGGAILVSGTNGSRGYAGFMYSTFKDNNAGEITNTLIQRRGNAIFVNKADVSIYATVFDNPPIRFDTGKHTRGYEIEGDCHSVNSSGYNLISYYTRNGLSDDNDCLINTHGTDLLDIDSGLEKGLGSVTTPVAKGLIIPGYLPSRNSPLVDRMEGFGDSSDAFGKPRAVDNIYNDNGSGRTQDIGAAERGQF